jgi:hypothetical protein
MNCPYGIPPIFLKVAGLFFSRLFRLRSGLCAPAQLASAEEV